MMWKFLLAVTIAGVAAENSQSTCTPKQQKFCPAGASNLGNTCQNDCTGCTGFTGQIQSFVPGSNHRRFVPCLKTGTPPSQKVCSYFGALLVFCPASASAQQSTCQNHCSGCTGFTVDGNTCQADGTPPSQTMCNNNDMVFVDNKCELCYAPKFYFLQSSTSCVACLGSDATGCTGTDVCSLKTPNTCVLQGADEATCVGSDATGCTGTDVCSLKTANTCVAKAVDDVTCAAIDAAKSVWLPSVTGGSCVECTNLLPRTDALGGTCVFVAAGNLLGARLLGAQNCLDPDGGSTCNLAGGNWGKFCKNNIIAIDGDGAKCTTKARTSGTGCTGTDVCSFKTANTCVAKAADDATCAAIDAAKSKWLESSASCVTCIRDDSGVSTGACTGAWPKGESGNNVCSTTTPNTCVSAGTSDASCAAIDSAFPLFDCVLKKCVNFNELQGILIGERCVHNDATCYTPEDFDNGIESVGTSVAPKWSSVSKKCMAAGTDDSTCAAIDAAKSRWLSPVTCAGAGLATLMRKEISYIGIIKFPPEPNYSGKLSKFVAAYRGSCVACLVTADCKGLDDFCSTAIPNTCVPFGDATCAANNAATWTMTITPTSITEKVGAAVRPRKIESGKCKCGVYARHPPQNHFFWSGVHPIYGENSDIGDIFSRTAHIAVKTATFSFQLGVLGCTPATL